MVATYRLRISHIGRQLRGHPDSRGFAITDHRVTDEITFTGALQALLQMSLLRSESSIPSLLDEPSHMKSNSM